MQLIIFFYYLIIDGLSWATNSITDEAVALMKISHIVTYRRFKVLSSFSTINDTSTGYVGKELHIWN